MQIDTSRFFLEFGELIFHDTFVTWILLGLKTSESHTMCIPDQDFRAFTKIESNRHFAAFRQIIVDLIPPTVVECLLLAIFSDPDATTLSAISLEVDKLQHHRIETRRNVKRELEHAIILGILQIWPRWISNVLE